MPIRTRPTLPIPRSSPAAYSHWLWAALLAVVPCAAPAHARPNPGTAAQALAVEPAPGKADWRDPLRAAAAIRGNPRVLLLANERAGQESARVLEALRAEFAPINSITLIDPSSATESQMKPIRTLQRRGERMLAPSVLVSLTDAVDLILLLTSEPERPADVALLAIDPMISLTIARTFQPRESFWTRDLAATAAAELAPGLASELIHRWAPQGPDASITVELTRNSGGGSQRDAINRILARLPGVRSVGPIEPPPGETNADPAWSVTYAGPIGQFAVDARTAISAATGSPVKLVAFQQDRARFDVGRKGDEAPTLAQRAYALARAPSLSVIASSPQPTTEPNSPVPDEAAEIAGPITIEMRRGEPSPDDPSSSYFTVLNPVNSDLEGLMLRAYNDQRWGFSDAGIVRNAPYKDGRTPDRINARLARVAPALLRELVQTVAFIETTVIRAPDAVPLTGTTRCTMRLLDLDSGQVVHRVTETWPFEPNLVPGPTPNTGPIGAIEGAGRRMGDAVVYALIRHWLEPARYSLEIDLPEPWRPAIPTLLSDNLPAVIGAELNPDGTATLWFEGSPESLSAALAQLCRPGMVLAGLSAHVDGRRAKLSQP